MKSYYLFILSLILPVSALFSQVEMGKWKTHLAYTEVSQVTQSGNKIYALSSGSLFSVDKTFGELELYSKVTGLNGNLIFCMKYDDLRQQLLILYEDGNIDIITSGGIINIPDYYNKQQTTSKETNSIFFYGDYAYLSTKFGVLVVNMPKREIADVYYIGNNSSEVVVLETTVLDGMIYALSESAIYQASLSSNLVNYENWSQTNALPGAGNFQSIAAFNDELYLLRGGALYRRNNEGSWSGPHSYNKTKIKISGGNLFACSESGIYQQGTGEISPGIANVQDIEYDADNNTYWFAAKDKGVVAYNGSDATEYKPSGPATNHAMNMTFSGQKLFVVPGGRLSASESRLGAVMIYENNTWRNILGNELVGSTEYTGLDFTEVAVNPIDNKHFFVTSIGSGLYEFKDDSFHAFYNHKNSPIEYVSNHAHDYFLYTWLYGTTMDEEGNLWVLNCMANKSVKILLNTGEWAEWDYFNIKDMRNLNKILAPKTNKNQKWITSDWSPRGVFIVDDGGTISDQRDDRSTWFVSFPYGSEGEALIPGNIHSIAEDKNGVIWLGTDQGPLLFYNTSNVFNSDYSCSRIIIPRNDGTGNGDYLLENEHIRAIAIDGANRKWLGTSSSGVYLMSEDGQETIRHFTTLNSPLLSNEIFSIAINSVTGEVFFATANGLVSYQGDAADANDVFQNVYAYPNPVRENYNGIITITGLVESTQVKITDLHGNLICETVSNGSIATWDGKDVRGRKVNTGIYFAICANKDGTQNAITKIMVIN